MKKPFKVLNLFACLGGNRLLTQSNNFAESVQDGCISVKFATILQSAKHIKK